MVVKIFWHDVRLKWDKAEYATDHLAIEADKLWVPADVSILESTANSLLQMSEPRVVIDNEGNCSWRREGSVILNVEISSKFFPFNYCRCTISISNFL